MVCRQPVFVLILNAYINVSRLQLWKTTNVFQTARLRSNTECIYNCVKTAALQTTDGLRQHDSFVPILNAYVTELCADCSSGRQPMFCGQLGFAPILNAYVTGCTCRRQPWQTTDSLPQLGSVPILNAYVTVCRHNPWQTTDGL
jgi:hypothetical protein